MGAAISGYPAEGPIHLLIWVLVATFISSALALSPISCDEVQHMADLVPMSNYRLKLFENPLPGQLPTVLADSLIGYKLPDHKSNTVAYHAIVFILHPDRKTSSGYHCMYPSYWSMEIVTDLSIYNHTTLYVNKDLRQGSITNDKQDEIVARFMVQGFRNVTLQATSAIASHMLLSNVSCITCQPHVSTLRYHDDVGFLKTFLPTCVRISLQTYRENVDSVKNLLALLLRGSRLRDLIIQDSKELGDPDILYPALPHLTALELVRIGLTNFPVDNFRLAPNLIKVSLSGNKLSTVPKGLRLLRILTILDVADNPISVENLRESLINMPDLRWLNVSHINLSHIDDLYSKEIRLAPNLEFLDMSWCNMVDFRSAKRFFGFHQDLEFLYMTGNPFEIIPSDAFLLMENLKVLDLSQTRLKVGPGIQVLPDTFLDFFSIARSNLSTPDGIFENSEKVHVKNLDLSGNDMSAWDSNVSLGFAQNLNLSYCSLNQWTSQMGASLNNLEFVDLGGNDFNCSSCRLKPLQTWLAENKSVEIAVLGASGNLTCSYPIEQRNVSILDAEIYDCDWHPYRPIIKLILIPVFLAIIFIGMLYCTYIELVIYYRLVVLNWMRKAQRKVREHGNILEFDAFICFSPESRYWVIDTLLYTFQLDAPNASICINEAGFKIADWIFRENADYIRLGRRIIFIITEEFVDKHWVEWNQRMSLHSIPGDIPERVVLLEVKPLVENKIPQSLKTLQETCVVLKWPKQNSLAEADALNDAVRIVKRRESPR